MNAGEPIVEAQVMLPERNRFGRPREAVRSVTDRGAIASAEVLRAHRSARICTALVLALLELGLFHGLVGKDGVDSTVVGVLVSAIGYVVAVSIMHVAIVRRGRASSWAVTLVLVLDLAFIHLLTWYATGASGAQLFAQRLCDRIARHDLRVGSSPEPVSVTASIGVAVGCPRGTADFAERLWSRADDALYAAKRSGRKLCSWLDGGDAPLG